MTPLSRSSLAALAILAIPWATPLEALAQRRPAAPQAPVTRSAPIANIRYDVTVDSTTATAGIIKMAMTFDVTGAGPVLLSMPIWTPGAYEVSNFARWVTNFTALAGGKALQWDKLDPDTWRIQPGGARGMTVRFDFIADTLDNAIAWTRPDFTFFNGTNVFLYPEGRTNSFRSTVAVTTQPGWKVVTAMPPGGAPRTFTANNYDDLVDMPFFIGRMDVDSTQVGGKWVRLASYPAGTFTGAVRDTLEAQTSRTIPTMARVFGETPWDRYTILVVFNPATPGGSALEHQSSHMGIYNPGFMGNPLLASITAHEIFHAWNVKRLRPADMFPYAYDRTMPTTWLWVSEGITDYYADLALIRGSVIDSTQFMMLTSDKIGEVTDAPPTGLEDASLSTWIGPVNGTRYLYYPKGSLAGLMLDILIRDASENRRSLDEVMREMYASTYKQGRGFTATDWWQTVSRAAGGKTFTEFESKYIDGRESFPWDKILPLAGMRLVRDSVREPTIGVATSADSTGIVVSHVFPNTPAADAGIRVGDQLLAIGGIELTNPDFRNIYRKRFANAEGDSLPIKVRRGNDTLTLNGKVRLTTRVESRIEADPKASPKAARIRHGIYQGTVDQ